MKLSESKLNFYTNMYTQMQELEKLYKDYFSLDKIKVDIISSKYILSEEEQERKYNELVSLECAILATMIGLNREKLEKANSEVIGRSLFQYKDYESSMKIFFSDSYYEDGFQVSKNMCNKLEFNKEKKGPFPYMLEILTDDNKNRPYDYISKIRNALLHGEYYLENQDILHITNHDEDGNLIFEAKLLMFSFEMFVIDFFGVNTLNSSFQLYNFLNMEEFKSQDDLIEFLRDFTYYDIKFTKIPEKYKFSGQSALYTKLNDCFGLDSTESKDVINEIVQLEKEGLEYQINAYKLNETQMINICEYLFSRYRNIYNNKEIMRYLQALIKLQIYPISEITNCLGNMITYISCKKDFLSNNKLTNTTLLNELKYDEYCEASFKYALSFLKANIISYAIECEEFEEIDLSLIDTKEFNVDDIAELNRRKNRLILDGFNEDSVEPKLILETVRNALAHGNDRVNVSVEKDLKTYLIDIYHKIPNLGVEVSLSDLNNIFSMDVFNPNNIKLKEEQKVKKV